MDTENEVKKPKLSLLEVVELANAGADLTDQEAAIYLRLSEKWGWQSVQKLVKRGKLLAGRVGDHYRFKKQHLDDFVFGKR